MEARTLRFSPDKPQLEYRYEQCLDSFFHICLKERWQTDTYDLTDPKIRRMLIDMGFVAKVREKF